MATNFKEPPYNYPLGKGTLSASITDTATTMLITSGDDSKFPNNAACPYRVTLYEQNASGVAVDSVNEIVMITGISSLTFTITRAQESTTARTWGATGNTVVVEMLPTTAMVSDVHDALNDIEDGTTTLTTVTSAGVITAGSGSHALTNATGLIDGAKIQDDTVDNDSLDNTDGYEVDSLDVGGGYGNTGVTLYNDGRMRCDSGIITESNIDVRGGDINNSTGNLSIKPYSDSADTTVTIENTDGTYKADLSVEGKIAADGIHNNGSTGTTGAIASGSYTPTFDREANITADGDVSVQTHYWQRVGQVVSVHGEIQIDSTAADAHTKLDFTIPVASVLSNNNECTGGGSWFDTTGGVIGPLHFTADSTNNKCRMHFHANSTDTHYCRYSFQYIVIAA